MVVPIGEDTPATPSDPVDRSSEARADRLHPTPERFVIVGLDDQMGVVPLQRVVHQTKPGSDATVSEGALDFPHDSGGAKRGHVGAHSESHVSR